MRKYQDILAVESKDFWIKVAHESIKHMYKNKDTYTPTTDQVST